MKKGFIFLSLLLGCMALNAQSKYPTLEKLVCMTVIITGDLSG